ncbi:transmembrane protein 255A isoform X2 [Ahaetulla prasina]|uniref:transmembrane protein 255A isoform X2 n=1 Tax=Ahaetulla prasina TaxID=499056 RepID=UPI0026480035|nr:transmembrane protein 255A isoform X2 [Ahaetulla prasina]
MRQALAPPRSSAIPLSTSAGSFNRRKRNSLYVTVSLLIVSLLILTVGLAATTRTQNVTVGGYYPGAILVASIVFISFGVIAAFCCAIVDGVFAARHIDLRPLYAGRCHYFAKSTTQPKTVCHPQPRSSCVPNIRTNTCFCCDLYHCGRREISGGYYEFIDVNSCQDIVHLYHLLWSATVLNILGLVLGIITAAVLGGFKDMIPAHPTLTCTVENNRPAVSYYSRPQVTSYNTYHSTPHLPPYSAYDFQVRYPEQPWSSAPSSWEQIFFLGRLFFYRFKEPLEVTTALEKHSSLFATSSPSGLPEDPLSLPPSPSLVWSPTGAPPRYSPPYFPPSEKPPPYSP